MEQAGASTVSHEGAVPSCCGSEPPQPHRALMEGPELEQPQPFSAPRQAQSVVHPHLWLLGAASAAITSSEPCTPARNTIANAIGTARMRIVLVFETTSIYT